MRKFKFRLGVKKVKIAIFNVFEDKAFIFCSTLLDKGYEILAVDDYAIGMFTESDEEKWLEVGRNSNFLYEERKEIIEKLKSQEDLRNFYYFIKEEEIRSRKHDDISSVINFCESNNYKLNIVSSNDEFIKNLKLFNNLKLWIIKSKDKWTETLKDLLSEILK
ncbi:MAG: hypothetical protein K0S34_1843 [Bacillales bacterium]|jgi:hypothetical protein|nr:hypothetical protein [Bacillales bacterium]